MKIVSKFKDYYDYLAYVYGIDDIVTWERRNFTELNIYGMRPFMAVEFPINKHGHTTPSNSSIATRANPRIS